MKSINFLAYKLNSGIWAFDHEHMNTIAEPLCNGTELVMNEYFEIDMKRKPVSGDQMNVFVSLEDFEDSDTVLSFQTTNDQGTTYLDMVLFQNVWLCPWLESYFGYKPETLYVKLTPVNPGKESFEKIVRTGINPLKKYLTSHENTNKEITDDELDKILEDITDEELTQFVNQSYLNGGRL